MDINIQQIQAVLESSISKLKVELQQDFNRIEVKLATLETRTESWERMEKRSDEKFGELAERIRLSALTLESRLCALEERNRSSEDRERKLQSNMNRILGAAIVLPALISAIGLMIGFFAG